MPTIVLAAGPVAGYSRFHARLHARCRFAGLYRSARSKGLQERAIWLRHGMRNALIPVATFSGSLHNLSLSRVRP